jgi:hypothetical protein
VRALYQHHHDSATITAQQTAAFLQLLQIDSRLHSGLVGSLLSSSSSGSRLQTFIQSAQDVLSYLRWHHSLVLLQWLRDFSSSGLQGFPATAADPVLLQVEMQQLLSPASLQQWYVETASSPRGVQQQEASQVSLSGACVCSITRHTSFSLLMVPMCHTCVFMCCAQVPPSRRLQSQHRLLLADADADLTSQLLSRMLGPAPAAASTAAARPRAEEQQPLPVSAAVAAAVAAEAMAPPLDGGIIIEEEELFADDGEWDGATQADQRPAPAAAQPSSGSLKAIAFALPVADAGDEEEEDLLADQPAVVASSRVQQKQAPHTKHAAVQAATAATRAEQGWHSLETAAAAPAGSSQRPRRAAPPAAATSDWAAATSRPAAGSDTGKALCNIQHFAPPGGAAAQRLSCPLAAPASLLAAARPITIPLLFLCLTFPGPTAVSSSPASEPPGSVPLPPSWHSEVAAANLVAQANKIFLHTGIQ